MRRLAAPLLGLAAVLFAAGAVGCGGDGPGDGDPAAFCDRLDRLASNDPFLAFGDTATPEQIGTAFQALRERSDELAEVAPPAARAATRDYQRAVHGLDDLLAEVGYRTDVDPREYLTQQQAYTEAAERLQRYLAAECRPNQSG